MKSTSITQRIKIASIIGVALVLMIGVMSLSAWFYQYRQVNYIIEDYFPKMNTTLKLEGSINAFFSNLEQVSNIHQNSNYPSNFKQLTHQLDDIEVQIIALFQNEKQKDEELDLAQKQIQELKKLMVKLNQLSDEFSLIEQNKQALLTKIQWLDDDFKNEIITQIQELNSQQVNIAKQYNENNSILQPIESELQYVYQLTSRQEQLKEELIQFLYNLSPTQKELTNNFTNFENVINSLKDKSENKIRNGNIITLQQMLNDFYLIIEPIDKLVREITLYQHQQADLNWEKQNIISQTKILIDQKFNESKNTFTLLNEKIKQQTQITGLLILLSLMVVGLSAWGFNKFYIKRNLTKRFSQLIFNIEQLNLGQFNSIIEISGKDEITDIARLLEKHIDILQEREKITQDLKETQNELIQAAKMAVVGQTMTTLGHEINQPLNAIGIYLFSLHKLIEQQDYQKAKEYLGKTEQLVERISKIIKALRQFSRNEKQSEKLQLISVKQSVDDAWNLLELKHKPLQAQLVMEQDLEVLATPILLEQIFVNLFNNAFDACKTSPRLQLEIQEKATYKRVIITDNGSGWQLSSDNLLQPFHTTKEVGLGLGLTVCQRIMKQFNGHLFIASSLNKSAVIILEFPVR